MRLDDKMLTELALDFTTSPLARLWHFVTADVRNAILDSVVMNHVRMADVVGNQTPVTPEMLMTFRDKLQAMLMEGVARGSRSEKLRFRVED